MPLRTSRAGCGTSEATRSRKFGLSLAINTRFRPIAFSLAILNDAPVPTPLTDAVNNMKVIEAVLESGRLNAWVQMGK